MPAFLHRPSAPDRRETARQLLQREIDSLQQDEKEIVERFVARRHVARNITRQYEDQAGLGERVADRVAAVGGSWGFILVFIGCLVAWMLVNSLLLGRQAFDPFPYILLNLCLSCVAAIQAPIIMMSQNRQSTLDRMRAENDYAVNIKAELEIMQVQEKLNLLRERDWAMLVDMQTQQIELLQRLLLDREGAPAAGDAASASNRPESARE